MINESRHIIRCTSWERFSFNIYLCEWGIWWESEQLFHKMNSFNREHTEVLVSHNPPQEEVGPTLMLNNNHRDQNVNLLHLQLSEPLGICQNLAFFFKVSFVKYPTSVAWQASASYVAMFGTQPTLVCVLLSLIRCYEKSCIVARSDPLDPCETTQWSIGITPAEKHNISAFLSLHHPLGHTGPSCCTVATAEL